MKETFLKTTVRILVILLLLIGVQSLASADSLSNRIVGVWDVQVSVKDCNTGDTLFIFPGLHKYELGGTGQVVPATNPAGLSAHMTIWSYVSGNNYQLAVKMFRFDSVGVYIGWATIRANVTINKDATEYTGSGEAEFFDSDGNRLGKSCPTFDGTRFQ